MFGSAQLLIVLILFPSYLYPIYYVLSFFFFFPSLSLLSLLHPSLSSPHLFSNILFFTCLISSALHFFAPLYVFIFRSSFRSSPLLSSFLHCLFSLVLCPLLSSHFSSLLSSLISILLSFPQIYLFFETFKLYEPNECDHNYVDIFDAETNLQNLISRYCGSVADPLTSKSNLLHLRFFALERARETQFRAWFTSYRPSNQTGEKEY